MADALKLAVQGAPLPPTFVGTPQQFFEALLERMRVIFPTAQTSFVISDTEPTSNQGPWLKNGTQWYVWDEEEKRYVPFDASPSLPETVKIATTEPLNPDDLLKIWVRVKGTRATGLFVWQSDAWVSATLNSGTTAQRPEDPIDYERYFDTDIKTEIYWLSSSWHTVSGSPGDIKHVAYDTLTQALTYNPGWREIGLYFSDDGVRGRAIIPAHKDAGVSPETDLSAGAGITARAAKAQTGAENITLTVPQMPAHAHNPLTPAMRRCSASGAILSDTGGLAGPGDETPGGTLWNLATPSTGGGEAHSNIQPSLSLWTLVKL